MTPLQHNKAIDRLIRIRYFRFTPPVRKPLPAPKPERIVERICNATGIHVREVMSSTKSWRVTLVRFIISHYLYENVGLTATETGRVMNRNHSSIFYHLKQYEALKSTKNKDFIEMLNKVKSVEI